MNEDELRPYSKLYRSARYMGADALLRRFYDLPEDSVVPLSVAHGVDFGQCHQPLDVNSIEPVHWSCNASMHRQAQAWKPSLLAPHPWVMHLDGRDAAAGKGVLVIGPPPSRENDAALHALIKHEVREDWSILVKGRGPYQASMCFWEGVGLRPVTASGPDSTFYPRLTELLARFDTVVGCTFSSALVFAASIGKNVRLVHGFTYRIYETQEYEKVVNLSSPQARAVVKTFAEGNRSATRDLSRQLLGFDEAGRKEAAVAEFRALMAGLRHPFWNDPSLRIPYRVREFAAMALSRPNVVRAGLKTVVHHLLRTNTCVMRIDEFDVWLNGRNPRNFSLDRTPYVAGLTEPGSAPGGYR